MICCTGHCLLWGFHHVSKPKDCVLPMARGQMGLYLGAMGAWKGFGMHGMSLACADTFASSHVHIAKREAGAVAMEAKHRKMQQYENLSTICLFTPVTVETSGSFSPRAKGLFEGIGRRLRLISGDPLSTYYLHQHISVPLAEEECYFNFRYC